MKLEKRLHIINKVKRSKMSTRYTNVQVNISDNQKQNLKRAMEIGEPGSISSRLQ